METPSFDAFLEEEISKVRGIAYPIRAGFLRRILIRYAAVSQLYPNPDDEFCLPEIGPNHGIMSAYK